MADPHVARLEGEIDLVNAPEVRDGILAGLGGASGLVVDLSAVTFFDSSGMRMLDDLAGACAAAGLPMRIVAPQGSPARMILRICAWPAEELAESTEAALGAV